LGTQVQLEEKIREALMVFSDDTVLRALRVMQDNGVRSLPVVTEVDGDLLGVITLEALYRAWAVSPLARLTEVLAGDFELVQDMATA
jgi:CBS-domain-containing membrane protein